MEECEKEKVKEFVTLFLSSVVEAVEVQCNRKFEFKEAVAPSSLPIFDVALTGTIEINSSVFGGTISLAFPDSTFLYVMEGMLGEPFGEIDEELVDGCAELLNIALGSSKKVLNERGFEIQKAIPTVESGPDSFLCDKEKPPALLVLFGEESYNFLVSINKDR